MQEYIDLSEKPSKNDYPHNAKLYYPYGYVESSNSALINGKIRDGGAVIAFSGAHSAEELHCHFVNGLKEGDFNLIKMDGNEFIVAMSGTFSKGKLEGHCEINDEDSGLVFEGQWVDGCRCGTCIEYEYGCVSFQGQYRNDIRNGYGWEYHDNELQREGIWINGKYQHSIDIINYNDFVATGLGMTVSDNEKGRVIMCCKWEENSRNGDAYCYDTKRNCVVEKKLFLNGDEIDVSDVVGKGPVGSMILPNGSQWKGGILQGVACGDGSEEKDGIVVFQGYMYNNMRFGPGVAYRNKKKEYDGFWMMNTRMGDGISYSEDGKKENEGVWIDDKYAYSVFQPENHIHYYETHVMLRKFIIGDSMLNDIVDIDFSALCLLEELTIGNDSCKEISEIVLKNMKRIRRVEIGASSCTQCINCMNSMGINKGNKEIEGRCLSRNQSRIQGEMKRFEVSNCASLESILMKQGACSDFFTCVIENAPKLKSIQIGEIPESIVEKDASFNFFYCPSFELMNLPSLENVLIGNRVFMFNQILRFHNLPQLRSIAFGNRSCLGKMSESDSKKCISNASFIDLPSLKTLILDQNFKKYRRVNFENIPNCDDIIVRRASFCDNNKNGEIIDHGKNISRMMLQKCIIPIK